MVPHHKESHPVDLQSVFVTTKKEKQSNSTKKKIIKQ